MPFNRFEPEYSSSLSEARTSISGDCNYESSSSDTVSVSSRHGGSRSVAATSDGSSSSSCFAGGALKRTCSSLSLLSDITLSAASAAASLCADGVDNDPLADDEAEPPDGGSYSPDFSEAERSASSSAAELLEHLKLSATELRLASSSPNSSERLQSKFRRRLLAKLKRHRKSNNASADDRRRRSANASLSSSFSSSRSSSPSSASSSREFAVPTKPQQPWPLRQGGGLVANGGNNSGGAPRGTTRSSSKSPFSRVRKLLRKKNRSLDLSRDARAASAHRSDDLSTFSLHSKSPENSHQQRHFRHHAHHQFTHMCTHCGRTHTLRATLTTTLTSARAGHGHSSPPPQGLSPVAMTRANSAPVRSLRSRGGTSETEAGSPCPNPDERDVIALSAADDPLSGTTQYCCKNSAADSDLFPIQEGKLMLTRNPSDAFPSSYKLQLRCSHFEESLLHQWFEIDHFDPDQFAAELRQQQQQQQQQEFGGSVHAHHTDVCEHCSAACVLCADELSSSRSSSSAGSGADCSASPFLGGSGGFVARPDYVYTLDENFSFERVSASA